MLDYEMLSTAAYPVLLLSPDDVEGDSPLGVHVALPGDLSRPEGLAGRVVFAD